MKNVGPPRQLATDERQKKPALKIRVSLDTDCAFLVELYKQITTERLQLGDFPEPLRTNLIDSQYRTRELHYQGIGTQKEDFIIELEGKPIGSVITIDSLEEIQLADIAILPTYQGQGYGSITIRNLIEKSTETSRSLRLHVEKNGKALSLYRRLGFETIEENEVHDLMEWKPKA